MRTKREVMDAQIILAEAIGRLRAIQTTRPTAETHESLTIACYTLSVTSWILDDDIPDPDKSGLPEPLLTYARRGYDQVTNLSIAFEDLLGSLKRINQR